MPAEIDKTVRRMEVPNAEFIFGSTVGMREIREKIERALRDDLPVLIEGESGTGKDTIIQYLHKRSAREEGPFLKLNCAAVPAVLLEGEIFGSGEGTAHDVRATMSNPAGVTSGGTLFLDEIGKMDPALQQKLGRAFKSGNYQRFNGKEEVPVNARLVGSSKDDLDAATKNHTFSAELLGCFSHHRLHLIPLRNRKEDIPELCEYLIGKFARDFSRPVPQLSSYVLEAFGQWKWPGNVRELENWIARIVIFGAEAISREFSRQLGITDDSGRSDRRGSRLHIGRARGLRRHS